MAANRDDEPVGSHVELSHARELGSVRQSLAEVLQTGVKQDDE